jgi:hypothetical protein
VLPLFFGALIALFTGTVVTPTLLPWIPFRAFSLKGLLTGLLAMALYLPVSLLHRPLLILAALLFFPAFSSFLALNFTGSTPFTGISGVKREMKVAVPFYLTISTISIILVVIDRVSRFLSSG